MNKIKYFIFKLYRESIQLDESTLETYYDRQLKLNAELESLLSSKFKQFRIHTFDNSIIVYVAFKSNDYDKTLDNIKSMGSTQIYMKHATFAEMNFVGDDNDCGYCKRSFNDLESYTLDCYDDKMRVDLNCGHVVHGYCLHELIERQYTKGTSTRNFIDATEFGTNEFHIKCPICKLVHVGNLIPLEYVILRAITICNETLLVNVLNSGKKGYYEPIAHFPLFKFTNKKYNTYYSRMPFWWDQMMKVECDKVKHVV